MRYRRDIDGLAKKYNALSIKPHELFCDTYKQGYCAAQDQNGIPLYFDDDHPSLNGAELIGRKIVEAHLYRSIED